MRYLKQSSTRSTPQSSPIPGTSQTPNSAGGFAWPVDDWMRLDRFLVLGSSGGSYYATEQKLTREYAEAVLRCIHADGARAVARLVAVSESGRAPKNDPALFALAMAAGLGDDATRRAALEALPRVARTGTHLFHFAAYLEGFRGWGRGVRKAVAAWYAQPAARLALQAVEYQQRDGWSHRDLLRLIWAFEKAKRATDPAEVARLVRDHRLPREAVPTEWLNDPRVWEALLDDMPITALIRNLATMTRVGLLAPMSDAIRRVVARLADGERLRAARTHPIAVLAALKTYAQGKGERGRHTWEPVPEVVDALDAAFYTSFANVEPAGVRMLLALDVSGSMSWGQVAGIPGLTPRVASAAMAFISAATEPRHIFVAFCDKMVPLAISRGQRLDDVVRMTDGLPFGGTDCALPMLWALENRVEVDTFVVYTDSETWYGNIHPVQALRQYRERTDIAAKLVVVAMVSNRFTIADPDDAGMLDVVGFDGAAPRVVSDFARGWNEQLVPVEPPDEAG